MKTIKVPDDVHEKLIKLSEEKKKTIGEVIKELLDKEQSGNIQIEIPRLKLIRLKYPTKCIFCKKELEENDLGFWSKGMTGVICVHCVVKESFGVDKQLKQIAKYEVEIRRIKAIKRELNKQIEELASQYVIYEASEKIYELSKTIEEKIGELEKMVFDYLSATKDEKSVRKIEELIESLKAIQDKLEKCTIPTSWAKNFTKKLMKKRETEWVEY